MPLRYIRTKLTADNALSVAVATASVSHELTDLLSFPPARAATGILLLIFKTIQDMQTNQNECYRLARRCLALLTDLRDAMDDKWETAPDSLLKNIKKFESTLQDIHDGLQRAAQGKWHSRLMKKNSLEAALTGYNIQVEDAARSFQIATLIHLHHATSSDMKAKPEALLAVAAPPYAEEELCQSPTSMDYTSSSELEIISPSSERTSQSDDFVVVRRRSSGQIAEPRATDSPATSEIAVSDVEALRREIETLEDHGFRRYHRSELVLNGRSRSIKTGWWTGAEEVQVEGRRLMMIPYDHKRSVKQWLRDVKTLQNVYHPNLPQMVGYSGTDAPTPFILLANVQTRLPQALLKDTIQNANLAECATLLVRLYKDLFDAAIYLQRQLNLSESKIQDYVEHASFRIEGERTMVMGLPPPEVDAIMSYRNFGLACSVRDVFLQLLPQRGLFRRPYDPTEEGTVDYQHTIAHLGTLARSLLPSYDSLETASSRISALLCSSSSLPSSISSFYDLDEEPEDAQLSLLSMRMCAIAAGTHNYTWSNNFVPAYLFSVGDIGYIPPGAAFSGFVRICNVMEDDPSCKLEVQPEWRGWQMPRAGAVMRSDLQGFEAHGGVTGWPLVMRPSDRNLVQIVHERTVVNVSMAWRILLEHARILAKEHDVRPEDLILVTRAGTDQRFYVSDNRTPPHPSHHPHHGFGGHPHMAMGHHNHMHGQRPGMHHPHHASFGTGFPPSPPAMFYLFTSPDKAHEAYLSDSPVHIPLPSGTARPPVQGRCSFGFEGIYGFMNYVQLHAEDFA